MLRVVVESMGTTEELWSETIGAVSDVVLARPDLAARGLGFVEAFDAIDLGAMRARAQHVGMGTTRNAIAVMLVEMLEEALAPAEMAA